MARRNGMWTPASETREGACVLFCFDRVRACVCSHFGFLCWLHFFRDVSWTPAAMSCLEEHSRRMRWTRVDILSAAFIYMYTHETPVRIVTADEMCVRALLYFSKSNPVARTVGTCRR